MRGKKLSTSKRVIILQHIEGREAYTAMVLQKWGQKYIGKNHKENTYQSEVCLTEFPSKLILQRQLQITMNNRVKLCQMG